MTTRIRYSKDKVVTNLLVSNQNVLLPNGALVQIILDTETNSYKFLNTSNGEVISTGTSNTLINVKKLVRTTLLNLGVNLQVEVKTWGKRQTEVAA